MTTYPNHTRLAVRAGIVASAALGFATAFPGLRLLPGPVLSLMLGIPPAVAVYALCLPACGERNPMRRN